MIVTLFVQSRYVTSLVLPSSVRRWDISRVTHRNEQAFEGTGRQHLARHKRNGAAVVLGARVLREEADALVTAYKANTYR